MGFGLGAAAGARIANPGRPVVLFTGDGCFRMNCAELATLHTYTIPVLVIVFNNRALGMVRQWQSFFYEGRYSETGLPGSPDFVKLSLAYGIPAYRAVDRASFLEALDASIKDLASGLASVIDVCINEDEKVLPMVPSGRPIDEQIL
jgi:acetolactate synthase-1/2/3 large subunit